MKNLKKVVIASTIVATSLSASNFSVKAGYDNIKFGNINDSGVSISMISSKSNKGFAYELGYSKGDTLAVTKFGGIYNWKISDKFYAGMNIVMHGINFTDNESYNTTSFTGYTLGLQGKYAINSSNSIDLSYGKGSATDKSGLISENLAITSIAYSYRF